jgi:hypothetical protein
MAGIECALMLRVAAWLSVLVCGTCVGSSSPSLRWAAVWTGHWYSFVYAACEVVNVLLAWAGLVKLSSSNSSSSSLQAWIAAL